MLDQDYTTATMLSSTSPTAGRLTATTDKTFTDLDLNYSYVVGDDTYYLRELDKTNLLMNSATTNHSADSPDAYTGVMAVQAGGKLAFAEDDSEFFFTPNQAISITNSENTTYNLAADTQVKFKYDADATKDIELVSGEYVINDLSVINGIDTNTFAPATSGLYVFSRNVDIAATGDDYEFSGYYYIKNGSDTEDGTVAKQGTYFALHNDVTDNRSDNVLPDTAYTIVKNANGSITFTPTKEYATNSGTVYSKIESNWYDPYGVKVTDASITGALGSITASNGSVSLFTAKQETIDNANLKWTYAAATETTPAKLSAYYDVNSDDTANADEVKVNIALSNLYGENQYPAATGAYQDTTKGNNWTMLGATAADASKATFYYNDDVEEGATTAKLVDSVELDKAVTKDAYLAFDFDLNVKMDSVQVTYDENGNETVTAAQEEFKDGDAPTKIKATDGVTNGAAAPEAGTLTWANT